MSLRTLLSSGINKLLSALPGNLFDAMPSLRPFAAARLSCGLQGLPHLPLVPSSLEQTSHLLFYSPALLTWVVPQCSAICYWNYRLCPSPCAGFLTDVGPAETLHMYVHFSLIAFTRVSCKSWPSWISSCQNNPFPIQFSCTQCNEATKSMCIIPEGSYQL